MNDRYLFKAKGESTEKWHVGLLTRVDDDTCWIKTKDGEYVCKSSTICCCTGLKDEAGNLIWENDIVLTPKEDGYSIIRWAITEAKWVMSNETEELLIDFDNYWSNEIEVVGNKIDNPELLEVE